ncbi:MAG: SUMF1/EgtB/PvdO family nonheme iron enzyme, partial [Opitutales bacterium]|nr:SUMF1/EgtB/PvdO family nonheme iron enzyme [Opitutales bacterium]
MSSTRRAYNGMAVLNGEIYLVGGNGSEEIEKGVQKYNPKTNTWSTIASMNERRALVAAVAFNGKIFAIGGSGGGVTHASTEFYDPATQLWTYGPALPVATSGVSAISLNGKVYLMGGYDGSSYLNQVLELSSETGQWISKTSMPNSGDGHKLVNFQNKIWAIGGIVAGTGSSAKAVIYDPVLDSWSAAPNMTQKRHWPVAWSTPEGIFVGSGFKTGNSTIHQSLEFFNPISNSWSAVGSLPEFAYYGEAKIIGEKVFVVGGQKTSSVYSDKVFAADLPAPAMNLYFKEGNATAEAELSTLGMADGSVTLGQLAPDALTKIGLDYNPATAEGSLLAVPRGTQPPPGYALYKRSDRNGTLVWEEKAPVSAARSTFDGAVGLNGKIYLMGGISSDNNATHSYDPSTNTWSRQSNMINPHAAGAFATAGGKVFAIGGTSNPTSFEIYDPASDQWTAGSTVPQPIKYSSAITLDGVVYVVGCKISDTNSNRIFAYDSISQTWSEKSNMPTARHAASLVVLDGKIWAMGGWTGQPSNVPTNKVEVYDPISNSWSNGPALDIAKAWTSAWVIDGNIHVAGGNDNQGGNYRSEVLRLDTGTNQWVQVSTLPEPKAYAGYAQIEGMIFQVSGSTANGVHSEKVYAADITPPMDLYYREANASGPIELSNLNADLTAKMNAAQSVTLPKGLVAAINTGDQVPSGYGILERTDRNASHVWEEMAPVSVARNIHDGSAVLNGKIYVAGGWTNTPRSEVERYDPSTNQWESLQSLSTPRNGPSLVALNGKLFCIGGSTTSSVDLATVEVYDPSSNQWSSGVSLPIPLTHLSAVVVGGKILVAGGQNSGGSSNQVFEFDPFSNQWTQKSSMLSARNGLRMVVEAGKVYALGGNIPKAERYDPVSDTWTSLPDMLVRRAYPFVWSNKGSIYAASGNSGHFESSIEVFDPVSQSWSFTGNVPSPRHGSGSVILGNKVFMISGDLGSSFYTNQVYAADLMPHRDLYFRSAASQINRAPANLNVTASLTIAENQAIGTVVGEFNATDPNVNATLTYHLVSGAGDGNNTLFTLETNGTLKTAATFDYESNASTYSIRVQARDEFNASVEGNFTVTLTNLNEPTNGNVNISGSPMVGQTLNVSNNLSDPDGLGVLSYQWYREGQPIIYGGTLFDGVNGVNGLNKAIDVLCSPDNKHVYVLGFADDSVSIYERNATTGELSLKSILKDGVNGVNGLNGPRDIVLSEDGEFAFVAGGEDDSISWFERDVSSGALSYLGILKDGVNGVDGLNGPHNIVISKDSRHAYVTAWNDNSVSWYEMNATSGNLSFLGLLKNGMNGLDGLTAAYGVAISPDDEYVYVTAAGDDSVSWFKRDPVTGDLSFVGMLKDQANGVDGLDGARSIELTSNGKFAYLAAASDGSLSWFERNASNGALTFLGILKDGVSGVDGLKAASHFILSHDEKQVYVVGWGDDAVSWYDRNATSGELDFGGILKDGIHGVDGLATPSSISLSADGQSVYVTSWGEHALSRFSRNPQSGSLIYGSANDANYTLTLADIGKTITVVAGYTDGGGFEHNVSSAGTPLVYPAYHPYQPNHFVDLNATVNLEMIWVEPGTFMMGQSDISNASPEHNVTLTKGFYLGKYEVTQAQYEAVMTGNTDSLSATPSNWPNNADRPVEKVSWDDIQKFLTRLNAQEAGNIPAGWAYVLPTEAQWEYACRAGTTTAYSWGDSITTSNANYYNNIGQTADVGQYSANPWGFFDMHGNVREWTADRYAAYSSGAQTDPEGPATGSSRVSRGGSWNNSGANLRSALRNYGGNPSLRGNNHGFRVGFQKQSADVASPEMSIIGDANITQLQGVAWVDPGVEAHDVRDG